jgi:type IV secretory pathway component VirB8
MTTQDKSFNEAKQLYMEQYGNAIVTGTYLKIALFLMAVGLVLSIALNLRTIRTFRDFRPLVIRIDDVGRAEAVDYHDLEYKPQDAEAKYFLTQFCRLYYRRNRFTIQDDFAKSLYFLDGPLANATLDGFSKSNGIKAFLSNQNGPDIDIEVKKVALENMSAPPYKARVDFYMVYYSAADRSEIKRVLYTANFIFFFKSKVPNDLIPINPLGMAISYFREDEAFAGGAE